MEQSIFKFAELPRGLVLFTGATGTGKSTTLACLVDQINRRRSQHILTIEDPIEYTHYEKRACITQRELGIHTHGFAPALKSALREDPDVILVGEMRDLETIHTAGDGPFPVGSCPSRHRHPSTSAPSIGQRTHRRS